MVLRQFLARLGPCVAAGERDHPHHPFVLDEGRIEVGNVGESQLEHHLPAGGQRVEALGQRVEQDLFRGRLVGRLDRDFRLEDRHEAVAGDLLADLELLPGDGGDPVLRGVVDHRAHLGAEHAERGRASQQRVEARHRLHQLYAVLVRLEPLVDLDDRHDAPVLPQIGRHGLALRLAVHGALEQDGRDHLRAGERRRAHDAHPERVHQLVHLGVVAGIFAVGDAVEPERARRRSAALIERSDEAALARHLRRHLFVGHGVFLALGLPCFGTRTLESRLARLRFTRASPRLAACVAGKETTTLLGPGGRRFCGATEASTARGASRSKWLIDGTRRLEPASALSRRRVWRHAGAHERKS